MDAGSYRKSIIIQSISATTTDEDGFDTDTWTDFYKNYAYVNKLSGTERWTAAQVSMDSIVRFTFRWHPSLDSVTPKRYRIKMGERIFQITNVDNVMFKNETVKIDGVEVEA